MTRVLVFTRTTAFRHDSIPAGVRAFQELGAAHGFAVEATEDPAALEGGPGRYGAVVFLSTSGDVLTPRAAKGCGRTARRAAASWGSIWRRAPRAAGRSTAS